MKWVNWFGTTIPDSFVGEGWVRIQLKLIDFQALLFNIVMNQCLLFGGVTVTYEHIKKLN